MTVSPAGAGDGVAQCSCQWKIELCVQMLVCG